MGNKDLKIEDELRKFNRRLEGISKQLDLLFADREILETIQGRLSELLEEWRLTRQHDNEVRKDIKEEIQVSGERVVSAVENKLESKPVVKKKRRWFWQRR